MTTKQEMLAKFDALVDEVMAGYDQVRELLELKEWAKACNTMTEITTRQANTSVAMRSAFMKAGYIKEAGK